MLDKEIQKINRLIEVYKNCESVDSDCSLCVDKDICLKETGLDLTQEHMPRPSDFDLFYFIGQRGFILLTQEVVDEYKTLHQVIKKAK